MSDTIDTSGFDTGLDWHDEDRFSEGERKRLLDWYEETHGTGSLDLVRFAPFLIENAPGSFKRYRRHVGTISDPNDGVALPQAVVGLLFLHLYTVIANDRGVLYEVIAAREWGATKAQVMETIGYGFLESGPRGINAVAELSRDYLRDWVDDGAGDRVEWPDGWAPAPERFRSGIDLTSNAMPDSELESILGWYRRFYGEEPRGLRLIAESNRAAFKTYRVRYERAIAGALPAQLLPLYTLHLATYRQRPEAMRRAVRMARELGVDRRLVVQTVWWGLLYGGETGVEAAADAITEELAQWER